MNDLKINATTITIDPDNIRHLLDKAVQDSISSTIENLGQDELWLEKIERMINQAVVQRTIAQIGSMDITSIIKSRVDEQMKLFRRELLENFSSTGIDDRASQLQMTLLDDNVVVEHKLTANDIESVRSLTTKDLIVKGSINVDNHSWDALSAAITEKTLLKLDEDWRDLLVRQVKTRISQDGIEFEKVKIGEQPLLAGNKLSHQITESNIQTLGQVRNLTTAGETVLNDTLVVVKNRVGINTDAPDAALSLWDEEIKITAGKHKSQEAYFGTGKQQALNLSVNNEPQITLGVDGVTAVKKLRVAQYRISHSTEVPNWSGTKGDVVFNANPSVENPVFAWVCLGAYRWKVIKAVE